MSTKTPESRKCPPAQNQYMQENILGEFIFARIYAGPVFALTRIQENIFEELFPNISHIWGGNSFRWEYMPRLYSHLREYRKILLGNYLRIGFMPGGTVGTKLSADPEKRFQELLSRRTAKGASGKGPRQKISKSVKHFI